MPHHYIPQEVPESLSPREVGALMAQLRAQFNLSQQEVSERLHIRTRYVSAIEEARYDLMPGKVYARGYVHTYAEFLGLNGEQAVARCFAQDRAAPSPMPVVAPRTVQARRMAISHWRGMGVLAVVALVLLVLVTQLTRTHEVAEPEEATVAPVPEAMLASVRTLVMPTPGNLDCLTTRAQLSCFYADRTTRDAMRLSGQGELRFMGDIDLSGLVFDESVIKKSIANEDAAPITPRGAEDE